MTSYGPLTKSSKLANYEFVRGVAPLSSVVHRWNDGQRSSFG